MKPKTAIFILIIIYLVGIIGLNLPSVQHYFIKLIPFNILFACVILLAYHKGWKIEFVLSAIFIVISGFTIELIGTKTGWIFGEYLYGSTLGPGWQGTPFLIGLNWLMLLYLTRAVAEKVTKEPVVQSILAAGFMTAMDFFIEPFAIKYNMWHWENGAVPMHNYIGWFFCSLILHYAFLKAAKYAPSKMAIPLFVIQLLFFVLLYVLEKMHLF